MFAQLLYPKNYVFFFDRENTWLIQFIVKIDCNKYIFV